MTMWLAGARTALILCCALLLPLSSAARAQSLDNCSPYANAVSGGTASSVPVVPDRLLSNWRAALPCLILIVKGLNASFTSPSPSLEARSKFLSSTGAIRTIMTNLSASEEKSKATPADQRPANLDTLNNFIEMFRNLDSLDAISVLTFGMRSDDKDMRLNSVLIMGNVIDNTSVCVPLIQVYDKSNASDPYYINGRANLLAVISVVAPWAYFENYSNIERTKDYVDKVIGADPSIPTTRNILVNIDQRLKSQVGNTNKTANLAPEVVAQCKAYMKRFLPNADLEANIKY